MSSKVKLPILLGNKIYKTGQTRGASNDEIYQNRVRRNSTVLIPYQFWEVAFHPPEGESTFENGFIVLIPPKIYFATQDIEVLFQQQGLKLGENVLTFYETREDWIKYHPDKYKWQPASNRLPPLGGEYVARVPATTATKNGKMIRQGFITTDSKGAGIRIYEYASKETIAMCRLQLEALFWLCYDAETVAVHYGMSASDMVTCKEENTAKCQQFGLLDIQRFFDKRLVSTNGITMCPLCLEEVSAEGFFTKVEQAEGRSVPDLTNTQLNLFHIEELRIGQYGHRPYNLGWGHHHCNVIVKDSGIDETLIWMTDVVDRNIIAGYIDSKRVGSS